MPPSIRRLAGLATAAALTLAGCGGGGSDESVKSLLDRAFKHPIGSADVNLDANLALKGLPSLTRPVRLRASGPYVAGRRGGPSKFDLDLKVGVNGGGASFDTGALSTGDRAFVKFEGSAYELPRSQVQSTNRALGSSRRNRGALKDLGLDARSWIEDAKDRGDESVSGVNTRHVGGKLNVRSAVRDLNGFVQRAGTRLGGAGGQLPRPLEDKDLDKIAEVVKDPSFDVYVGKSDDAIRRLSARFQFDIPDSDRARAGGLQGGTLQFTLEFRNVGGSQKVVAPSTARPISALTTQLGALGGNLGGAVTPGGAGGSGADGASPSGGAPGTQDFRRYGQCLDRANPSDTRALQRCSDLLNSR